MLFRIVAYLAPVAICVAVHWHGITAWFQQDDFAWLGIGDIAERHGLAFALFHPFAQGTVRPISERLFFLTFFHLFGLDALPFRLLVFATQTLNICLLVHIFSRLSGSLALGCSAAIVWAVHHALTWPLVWTSAYNQVLLAACFLGAFTFLLRYTQEGRARDNAAQWAIHLFGYGALEANVAYPLIAIAYVALFARTYIRRALWLLVPAIVYTAGHFLLVPKPSSGVYALRIGNGIATMARYLLWTVWPGEAITPAHYVAAVLFIAFLIWRLAARDRVAAFGLAWLVAAVSPYLPLSAHVSDYYLALPAIGFAMLVAHAVSISPHMARVSAAVFAVAFVAVSSYTAWTRTVTESEASERVRNLVLGVAEAGHAHPGRTVLLEGIDDGLFWNAIHAHPFRLTGLNKVYLSPENAARLTPYPDLVNIADYTLTPAAVAQLLASDRAVVYLVEPDRIRNVTGAYRAGKLHPTP